MQFHLVDHQVSHESEYVLLSSFIDLQFSFKKGCFSSHSISDILSQKCVPYGKCIHQCYFRLHFIPTSPSGHIEREEKNTSLAVPSLTFFKNPSKLNVRLPSTKTHLGKKNLTEVYSQSFPDKIERFDGYSVRFSLTFRACMTLLSVFNSHSKCFFMRKKISLFKVSQQVLVQISKNLLRHSVYCTQACHKYKNVYPKKGIQYDPFFACRYKHGRGFYVCLPFLCLGLPSKSSAELSCVKNAASLSLVVNGP